MDCSAEDWQFSTNTSSPGLEIGLGKTGKSRAGLGLCNIERREEDLFFALTCLGCAIQVLFSRNV
jgi:hypothetical protein